MSTPRTSLHRHDDHGSVVIEADFPTDPEDLWTALTDPERLARWLTSVEGEPALGGTVRLRFTSGWEGTGHVVECVPPERLVVETTEDGGGTGALLADLIPLPHGTRLRLEERGIPVGMLHAYGAGWQTHVEHLGTHLEGARPGPWSDRVRVLKPELAAQPVHEH